MAEKNLSVKLSLNDKQFQSSLKKATRSLKKFGASMKRTGQTMTTNLTLPIIGLGAAAVKLGSDFSETQSKFNTVFKDISFQANETAKNLEKDFGLSSKAALQLLGDTGDLLTGFGFTQEEALELSKQVNELAVDLASFTNFSGGAEGASQALTKALLGERESIKSLGIAITEADLKTFASEQGLVFKELDRVAKATLTYQLAAKQSKNAIGDFSRTSGSLANQLRQLKADFENVGVEIGQKLIPIVLNIANKVKSFLNGFSNLDSKTQEIIIGIALLTATLGPLLIVLGSIAVAIAGISAPVLATVAAVTALAAAIVFITDNWEALKERFSDISWWKNALIDMLIFLAELNPFNTILESFNNLRKLLGKDPLDNPFDIITDGLESLKDETKEYENEFNDFGTSIKNSLNKVLPLISKFNKGIRLGSGGGGQKKGSGIVQDFTSFDNRVVPEQGFSLLAPITQEELDKISQAVELQKKLIIQQESFAELNQSMTSAFASFGNTLQGVFAQALKSSDGFFSAIVDGAKKAFEALVAQLIAMIAMRAILAAIGFGSLDAAAGAASEGLLSMIGLADGGLATGPTVAMVGEGPGTTMSNPEVIAPLDRLRSMIGDSGGGNVQVFGTIKGADILLSSDRAKNNRNRTRGY